MFESPDHMSHECNFCQTVIFDPSQTSDPVSGQPLNLRDYPDTFFLGPTLDAVLAAEYSCPVAKWLTAHFKLSLEKGQDWDDVCARAKDIKLCYYPSGGLPSVGCFVLLPCSPTYEAVYITRAPHMGHVYPFARAGKSTIPSTLCLILGTQVVVRLYRLMC